MRKTNLQRAIFTRVLRIVLFVVLVAAANATFSAAQTEIPASGGWPGIASLAERGKLVAKAKEKKQQFEKALKVVPEAFQLVAGETPWDVEGAVAAFAADPSNQNAYDKGPGLTDVIDWLQRYLAKPSSKQWRLTILNRVFQNVHGRDANLGEQTFLGASLMNKAETYSSLVLEQRGMVKKNKAVRTALIGRAYQFAMGRAASADEVAYWLPRSDEFFAEIIAAARGYLYSEPGKKDVRETIVRAYAAKKKPAPSQESIGYAISHFANRSNRVYAEMLTDTWYSWE